MSLPFIYKENCTGCGECVKVCPAGCIMVNDYAELVRPDKCISCGRCYRACSQGAISLIKEYAGV